MVDMSAAMESFQGALDQKIISPIRGELDHDLHVLQDIAGGLVRMTYVYIANSRVTAFASIAQCDPIDGMPCFQIGYAVAEDHRGKGLAKKITAAAMEEFSNGITRNGAENYVIEAAVGINNEASLAVARAVIAETGTDATDHNTGQPIKLFHKNYGSAG